MTVPSPAKPNDTVGALLRRRLREIKRTPEELAEAVAVPPWYIDDLMSGSRRPPLPGRTDIYEKMTAFLRLGRNEVATRAHAERASTVGRAAGPKPLVRGLLLELCEPRTARRLERRRTQHGGAELTGLTQRLLDVAQGAVRRSLDDQIGLRLQAAERGSSYVEMRARILEFLDVTPDMLTAKDLTEFLHPRIARWDVDLETGVLRVVMRPQGHRERTRRPA